MLIWTEGGYKPFQTESATMMPFSSYPQIEFEPIGDIECHGPWDRVGASVRHIFARDYETLPEPKQKCLSTITPIVGESIDARMFRVL